MDREEIRCERMESSEDCIDTDTLTRGADRNILKT